MHTQLYEIMRPVKTNAGRVFPRSVHATWEKYVLDLCGGLTVMPQARGAWRDDGGRVYREPMRPVRMATTAKHARQIANYTKKVYNQKAVMCYALADRVTFV